MVSLRLTVGEALRKLATQIDRVETVSLEWHQNSVRRTEAYIADLEAALPDGWVEALRSWHRTKSDFDAVIKAVAQKEKP